MVSERSNNETLEKFLGITQTKTAAAVDTTMEKLLQRIQTLPIYPIDQPSPPSAQPSGQKRLHALPLSDAWAHVPPSINLTAHPIRFYASSSVQPSYPSGHPLLHVPPIVVGQQPSKLSNLYSNANLFVDPVQRAVFEISTSLAQTDLPMYSKNSNSGRIDVREIASTSQPIGSTASQISSPILSAIAQSGFLEHFVSYTLVPNVLHVPKLSYNLLSISKTTHELHRRATFLPEFVCFQDLNSGRTIDTARHSRGLYILNDDTSGHPNFTYMKYLFLRLFLKIDVSSLSCDGPSKVTTSSGKRWFVTFIDDYTRLTWVYLITDKSEPLRGLIVHQNLCAYTPQQNGVAERKNRHLLKVACSLMLSTSLPSYLWGDAILTAAHLINRILSRILHLQTPLECLKESYPSTDLVSEVPLRVFGCTAYVHSFGPNQTKFTPRAQTCVFVEHLLYQCGYKCFHPPSRKYFVTMDVTFCEDLLLVLCLTSSVSHLQGESVSEESNSTFEFIEPTPSTVFNIDPHPIILPTNQVPWKTYYRRNLRKEVGSPTSQPPVPVQDSKPLRDQGMENPTEPCTNNTMNENDRSNVAVLENVEEKNSGMTEVRIETSNDEAEQGHTRKLDEYDPSLDIPIALRKGTRSCTKHPICNYVSYDNLSPQFRAFTASLGSTIIPKNIYTALECHEWKNAVMEEMKALEKNRTIGLYTNVKNAFLNGDLVEEVYMSPRQDLKRNLVAKSKEGISVSQRKYTLDLLTETGMLGCCPADTLIEFNCKLGNSDDQVPVDKEQYQCLVGKLIYLSHTRLDISFAVSVVSQFMQAPYEKHMEESLPLCTFVWGNLVTWRSKKQSFVARSSAEAEYRAMSLGICEEIWLQKVLSDLHQECETPLKLFCDNKAAISIVNNPVQHDRAKHVEIDRHFIKERLDSGNICISYVPSSQQVDDVLTKGLLRPLCVSKLGLIDIYVPT
ncbi:Cysteine-rich RLK (RECEPTOR-like protein kinase) 8 [Cucumis melo var. makuwa]|uniref:Cysteine-rich RLK (RECEPTOR-like protein kinase) 8 n=1 Tax=Cucumis melo var. makuwa TaxID=1194695 RepID=A0A5A7UDP9_CUCMM|nr:Cysteine-rich RLK (RECEPTOR-like protein kinase) 8 [Cucumis melo var. makuwa]